MVLSCFRASRGTHSLECEVGESPRPKQRQRPTADRAKTTKTFLHRHSSADSRASTWSNESISKLPPCNGVSDPAIEAMMMPVPAGGRPSRCLRLSNPKTYGDIVASMKCEKGCRDWRSFAVFYDDDVDMKKSADDIARKVAADYERKWKTLNSFSSEEGSKGSIEVDMIG